MHISKLNIFLSTFNLFLIFVGYQLVTSLFLPNYATYEGTEEGTAISRFVTIPYRIFALLISIVVIIQNWRNKPKINKPMKLYLLFWGLLIIRIVFDLYVRTDIKVSSGAARETIIYVFFVCLIPTFSVYKSIQSIDFSLAFRFILFGFVILIPIFYYNNPLLFTIESTGYRLSGNIAMSTIIFGHYGVTLALFAFFWGRTASANWKVFLSYFLIAIGAFVMLRAGSRGPLVALVACFIFYYVAKQKNSIGIMVMGVVCILLLYVLSDFLFDLIRSISPMLAARMTLSGTGTEYEEFSSGRTSLYEEALNRFYDSPFLGESFAIFHSSGSYIYSHNMVLDAFMALGLLGGGLFVVMLAYALIHSRNMIMFKFQHWWIALVCVQYIIFISFSGAFYQSGTLNVLLTMTLLFSQREKTLLKPHG